MNTFYIHTRVQALRVRLVGTRSAMVEQWRVAVLMLLVAGVYEFGSAHFAPEYAFNAYEFVGTWGGLVCVWLSRTRNILCWPWGIVSAAALGVFFLQINLPGQAWLNLGYFLIIQLWAWPYWAFGGAERTELPVSKLSWTGRVGWLTTIVVGTIAVYGVIGWFSPGSFHPWLDSTVVVSSVVAQFLLGRKKVESWVLWLGPVNMLSIMLFFLAGAYTVTALYIAFFVHAVFALRSWNSSLQTDQKNYV